MPTIHSYTRVVGGKRQKVGRYHRGSVPAFARAQLAKAWRSTKRKQATPAIVYGSAAVGTYAAWGLFQAGTAALTTVGMAGLVAGYGIHRRRQRARGNLPSRSTPRSGVQRTPRSSGQPSSSNWSRAPQFNPDGSITTFHKDGKMRRITTRKPTDR